MVRVRESEVCRGQTFLVVSAQAFSGQTFVDYHGAAGTMGRSFPLGQQATQGA